MSLGRPGVQCALADQLAHAREAEARLRAGESPADLAREATRASSGDEYGIMLDYLTDLAAELAEEERSA
jgi:hypothetical protein